MTSLQDNAMAAPPTITDDLLDRWRAGLEEMFALVAGRFAQVESRRRARMYVLGLLSGVEWKHSWTIAKQAGDLTPDGKGRDRRPTTNNGFLYPATKSDDSGPP